MTASTEEKPFLIDGSLWSSFKEQGCKITDEERLKGFAAAQSFGLVAGSSTGQTLKEVWIGYVADAFKGRHGAA